MGRPTPETGGGTPQNQGFSEFKVLPEQKGVGPRVQKPEVPKQQAPDRNLEAIERMLRKPRRSGVAGGEAHHETNRRLERLWDLDDTPDKG
jgi:hypothetical protein